MRTTSFNHTMVQKLEKKRGKIQIYILQDVNAEVAFE